MSDSVADLLLAIAQASELKIEYGDPNFAPLEEGECWTDAFGDILVIGLIQLAPTMQYDNIGKIADSGSKIWGRG